MILARDTVRGAFYRRTRGETPGRWMERLPYGAGHLSKRLKGKQARGALTASEATMLGKLNSCPDFIPMLVHLRGVDPFTSDMFEVKWALLVHPDAPFRQVASRPGYRMA